MVYKDFEKRRATKVRYRQSSKGQATERAYAERQRLLRQTPDGKLKTRRVWLQRAYGLSFDPLDVINKCQICGRSSKEDRYGRLCIDHDHKTGKYRGVLCRFCNRGLARWGDNEAGILRVLAYVRGEFL